MPETGHGLEARVPQTRRSVQSTGLDSAKTRAYLEGKQAQLEDSETGHGLEARVPQTRRRLQSTGLDSGEKTRAYLEGDVRFATNWFELTSKVALLRTRVLCSTLSDAMKRRPRLLRSWFVVSIFCGSSSNRLRQKKQSIQ